MAMHATAHCWSHGAYILGRRVFTCLLARAGKWKQPPLYHCANQGPVWAQLSIEIESLTGLEHLPQVQERLGFGHIEQEGELLVFDEERDLRLVWHYLIEPFAKTYFQKFCYFYFSILRGHSWAVLKGFQRGGHNWSRDPQLGRDKIWLISY